jgi:hypothetical protein
MTIEELDDEMEAFSHFYIGGGPQQVVESLKRSGCWLDVWIGQGLAALKSCARTPSSDEARLTSNEAAGGFGCRRWKLAVCGFLRL